MTRQPDQIRGGQPPHSSEEHVMNNMPSNPTFVDVLIALPSSARVLHRDAPAHAAIELGNFVIYPTTTGQIAIDSGNWEAVADTLTDALLYIDGYDDRAQDCDIRTPNTRGHWSGISFALAALVAGLVSFIR